MPAAKIATLIAISDLGDDRAGVEQLLGADDLLGALLGALGAVEAHRRLAHAVGADRPIAPLADHAGTPVGVPVAGLDLGAHGGAGYRPSLRVPQQRGSAGQDLLVPDRRPSPAAGSLERAWARTSSTASTGGFSPSCSYRSMARAA